MNILVTGKNGQLGSEIQVLANDCPNFNFIFTDVVELDITDRDRVQTFFAENTIDIVINCAAYTAVDKAEDEYELADRVNNQAVEYLVEAATTVNARFIHISTDYVFDGSGNIPYTEVDGVSPLGVYGKTKLAGEQHVLKASIPGIVIRTSWVYSSFGNNFVKTMMRLGKEREELGVIVDQIGSPTYARDLAEVCLSICVKEDQWRDSNEVYHYSNDGVCSWYDFATTIMELNGIDCVVKPIETIDYPTKAERPLYSVLNKKKIKEHFLLSHKHWKKSLVDCIYLLNGN
ncbi:dTDP-4-dehydrorhamnose reductase [Algivirga pacifica]|uniref:dTDP-4-dehydrorhamnose reductase n=1 Tax=Algivirga pacifica TaxID=1162670 RepID=A0ABP9D4L7_9BACT